MGRHPFRRSALSPVTGEEGTRFVSPCHPDCGSDPPGPWFQGTRKVSPRDPVQSGTEAPGCDLGGIRVSAKLRASDVTRGLVDVTRGEVCVTRALVDVLRDEVCVLRGLVDVLRDEVCVLRGGGATPDGMAVQPHEISSTPEAERANFGRGRMSTAGRT